MDAYRNVDGILVIDVGTTGVRAAVVSDESRIVAQEYRELLPHAPADGIVEHDAQAIVETAESVATAVMNTQGISSETIGAVGLTVQRATTVVWDAGTGRAVGPAIGWQDLRTLGECLQLVSRGYAVAPNMSATKAQWLVRRADEDGISRDKLRFGTIDTWLAWKLTGRQVFATDPTNASVTGLVDETRSSWDPGIIELLDLPESMLPEIVPTSGVLGTARIGDVDLPLAALVGDQQSSLVGQSGLRDGVMKTTYGTAAMTDLNVGPDLADPGASGSYPIVAAATSDSTWYGLEATVITAGEAMRSLVDLGIAKSPADAARLASSVDDAGDVVFVPAALGLGSPYWDYGARSTFAGMSLSTGPAEMSRAVLEGIASRVTECVRSIEQATGRSVEALHVDGGASASDVLLQAQANQLGIPVKRSAQREATALGAGLLAGLAIDVFSLDTLKGFEDVERVFEPIWADDDRAAHTARWQAAVDAAKSWVPELSAIDFTGAGA